MRVGRIGAILIALALAVPAPAPAQVLFKQTIPIDLPAGSVVTVTVDLPDKPADGWREFPLHENARTIYVDADDGDDRATGGDPTNAVRSLAVGVARLRNGFGDHLRLQRGDVWREAFPGWTVSGHSALFPVVVGAYGEGARPRIEILEGGDAWKHQTTPAKWIALCDLDLAGPSWDHPFAKRGTGISTLGPLQGLTIEGCIVSGFRVGVNLNSFAGQLVYDVTIRRTVIVDCAAYTASPSGQVVALRSQGLHAVRVEKIAVIECVIDYNGWRDTYPREPLCHNVYIQHTCSDVSVLGTLSLRPATNALMIRPGGRVADNVASGPFAIVYGTDKDADGLATGLLARNVVTDQEAPAFGITIQNARKVEAFENVVANAASDTGRALILDGQLEAVRLLDCVVYDAGGQALRLESAPNRSVEVDRNWLHAAAGKVAIATTADYDGGISVVGNYVYEAGAVPPLADATRSLARYVAEELKREGMADFYAALRGMRRGAWSKELTAGAIGAWIRAGVTVKQ